MALVDWAYEVSEDKLASSLPRRWAHVQGVARQARTVQAVVGSDAELLEAAAVLHDVGYAPDLAETGFHPVDGAVFLASVDASERLVHLVAHHSYAAYEADLRDLRQHMTAYSDEGGPLRDALWYCDLTTSPDGETVRAHDRIAEIKQRYGPDHLVTRFITGASAELLSAVERTQRRLAEIEG
ncbi:HD domain-containing protein [Prauserella cavernicola]|uniref:HD domain-containing protein n=1 Tax=Prauserella cavernicola TaxID=2800127 RepID=A0A934QVB4_9PSEU|nr:HD domain-containing protein [Prauserella cavernicola]MBK1785984.1 HD domain-containing protein [Prauserella cavernicola]